MLKNPKGSLFSEFSALCDLAETLKKFEKIRKIFSQFLVLKDRFFKDRSFFYATFLKFVFTEAAAQFLQKTKRLCDLPETIKNVFKKF